MLLARDLASVDAGVEKLRSAGDPSLFDALLEGVRYEPDSVEHGGRRFGALRGNELLTGSAPAAGWLEHALLALVAAAPDGSRGARLRDQVTSLYVSGVGDTHPFPRKHITILNALPGLPQLHALYLKSWHPKTVGLELLGRLPALEVVHLESHELGAAELSALGNSPRVAELVLDYRRSGLHGGWPCPLPASLERFVVTRDVPLPDLEPLAACANLRVLTLNELGDVRGLERHEKLEELSFGTVGRAALGALSRLTRLRRLSLWGAPGIEELDVSELAELEELVLRLPTLRSLTGLGHLPRLRKLELHAPAVEVLPDLHPDAVLDELALQGCTALRRLPPLSGSDELRALDLRGHAELESIVGLSGLSHLDRLDISDCAKLETLTGIEGLSSLRVLVANGCSGLSDVSALAALQLTLVAAHGTRLSKHAFPAHLRRCVTTAASATNWRNLEALVQRTPPAQRPATERKHPTADVRKIASLLTTRDHSAIDQGVELLRSLDSLDLFDQLLEGTGTRPLDDAPELRELAANARFTGTAPHQPFLNRALLHVVAAAPPGSIGEDVRNRVDFVSAESCEAGDPVDLEVLSAFPKLTALSLLNRGDLRLGSKPLDALRCLTLSAGSFGDLTFLRCTPGLEALSLSGSMVDTLEGIQLTPKLWALYIAGQHGCDLGALRGHPSLKWLKLGHAKALDGIAHLPALEALDLRWSTELTDLSPLSDLGRLALLNLSLVGRLRDVTPLTRLQSLECVVLSRTTVVDFAPLAELRNLRRLCLAEYEGWNAPPDNLGMLPALRQAPVLEELDLRKRPLETAAPLAGMPALKHVTLTRCEQLHDVTALASIPTLEEIDLGFCERLTDIDALAELPKLRRVWVRSTGLKKSSVSAKLRDRCDWEARDQDGDRFRQSTQLNWSRSGPRMGG